MQLLCKKEEEKFIFQLLTGGHIFPNKKKKTVSKRLVKIAQKRGEAKNETFVKRLFFLLSILT